VLASRPKVKRLLWASINSFRCKDGGNNDTAGSGRNAERNFHREKRSNKSDRSTTDPAARQYKKPAKLCYKGHALTGNRNGLAVGGSRRERCGGG
jgi:hypothetical protein